MDMKAVSRVLVISSVFLTISCGKKALEGSDGGLITSSVIIGDIDWHETEDLAESSVEAQNAKAVGKINIPYIDSRCTAFLISEDVIMTNQHCIETAAYARGVTATFDLVEGTSEEQATEFDCSEFIGNDPILDFALLRCQGAPGVQYGTVSLAHVAASIPSNIYVIHQNCDYYTEADCVPTKKISNGKILKIDVNDEYVHNGDTLGGSSGSPVFGADHSVVAIHHAGAGFMGRGYENYAVPMFKIVAKIQSSFPGIIVGSSEPTQPQATRIYKNRIYTGEIVSGREIHAVFNQSSKGNVIIKMDIDASAGDLDLYLKDGSGKIIARSVSTTKMESIAQNLAVGDYIVSIAGYRGAAGKFRLKINNN